MRRVEETSLWRRDWDEHLRGGNVAFCSAKASGNRGTLVSAGT